MVLTARARRRAFSFAKAISQLIFGSLNKNIDAFRNITVQANADFFTQEAATRTWSPSSRTRATR